MNTKEEDKLFASDPVVLKGHENGFYCVAVSVDKKFIASGCGDGIIRIWEQQKQTKEWQTTKELIGHTKGVYCLAFVDIGGQLLLSGSGDRTIVEWDVDKGEQLFVYLGHTKWVESLSILRDTNIFVTCSEDRTIRFWDRASRAQVSLIETGIPCYAVAVRADKKHIAVGGNDGYLAIWDYTACFSSSSAALDGNRSRLLKKLRSRTSWVGTVCYNRDGSLLASGSADKTITIHNSSTDEYPLLRTLTGHSSFVNSVAFVDNNLLFSGSSDKTIKLWDAADGRCIRTIATHTRAVNAVATSSDGSLLVSGGDNTMAIIARGDEVDVEELFGDMKNAAGNLSSSSSTTTTITISNNYHSNNNDNSDNNGNKRRRLH